MKNRSFVKRAGFAVAGWIAAWRRERSFRTQVYFAVAALLALVIVQPAPIWWAVVGLTVALVLAFELVNSALKAVIDHLHPGIHPEIKAAKDMLAGAVLAIGCAALVVAVALMVTWIPAMLAGWG